MDHKLRTQLVYLFADTLGAQVTYDSKAEKLTGDGQRDVFFGDTEVPFKFKIVSSLLLSSSYMIMVKVVGNLGLFMASRQAGPDDVAELHVLNLAKMDTIHGWLEKTKPKDLNAAIAALAPAIVKSFVKQKKNQWDEAA